MTANHLRTVSPAPLSAVWKLVNHGDGATLVLSRFPATLGRRPTANLCVPQPSVSGLHAEFSLEGGTLLVRDLGSTNGTFVNGRRVTEASPVAEHDLIQFGKVVYTVTRHTAGESQALSGTYCVADASDQALALAQFERLFSERAVTLHYQPIVAANSGETVAFEVLGRSRLYGLNSPAPMFEAATVLHKEAELSRLLRSLAIGAERDSQPPHLFVNTHPRELEDLPSLIGSLRGLRRGRPSQPLTLEIHEGAVLNTTTIKVLRLALNDLNMRLAYDDFGAGQARLAELIDTQPDYVKFDMRLVRDIHQAPMARWIMLSSLVGMVRNLGIATLAEGVECAEEAEVCREIGFDLFQGYHFGRPAGATHYFGAAHARAKE